MNAMFYYRNGLLVFLATVNIDLESGLVCIYALTLLLD